MEDEIFSVEGTLEISKVRSFLVSRLQALELDGKRVLVLVPDGTRTMPVPLVYEQLTQALTGKVAALDFMVALGTHPPMADEELSVLFDRPVRNGKCGDNRIFNHEWDNPKCLDAIGIITDDEMRQLTGGKLVQDLLIQVNRRIFDYDQILIFGPVFPHEVVGFSGGNKYFFPGIAGPAIINFTHWLGALLTNYAVNGTGYTPVRAVIDRAAAMIHLPKTCFAFVMAGEDIAGIFFGSPEQAWQGASALSAKRHIHHTGRTYQKVLSILPEMYTDLWVGGKGMYKLEPVIADGGEVVIYAPHIHAISPTHGLILQAVGYHVAEYFLKQWEDFKHYPWSVLAHATHVKGLGTYDLATGVETPRIKVSLATGISKEVCQEINLGYVDPASIRFEDWRGREEEGILVVEKAGEQLYRVQ